MAVQGDFMLDNYTLLDLETTGATPLKDRITEIALVRFENGEEIARWQTLVNPECPIPPFIQNMTSITDSMVASAPTFAEVADTLLAYLENTVLAAHNVRFDYGFLKAEFKRIGITLRQRVLCTVKLSRTLFPEHHQHGLDALIRRHGLHTDARHRAMGDVELLIQFLGVAKDELGAEHLHVTAQNLIKESSLPPNIDSHLIDPIPESPGVYLFYGENALPLYIGKSVNLKERVISHFQSDHASTKEMRISQEIKHIEWVETAGELGALLLESRLVKTKQPIHNRQLRRDKQLCSWKISASAYEKPLLTLVREEDIDPSTLDTLFGTFRTKKQATEALRSIAQVNALCPQWLGLETGKSACFAYQLKRCNGVCCEKENPEIHYLRLQQALMKHRFKSWPYSGPIGIREYHAESDKTEIHVIHQWCHLATVDNESELEYALAQKNTLAFDLDTYKLLYRHLQTKPTVIQL